MSTFAQADSAMPASADTMTGLAKRDTCMFGSSRMLVELNASLRLHSAIAFTNHKMFLQQPVANRKLCLAQVLAGNSGSVRAS